MDDMAVLHPFKLDNPFSGGFKRWLFGATAPTIERMLKFPAMNQVYAAAARDTTDRPFYDKVIDVFRVKIKVEAEDLAKIARSGPLVVVANHPLGGIEGLAMLSVVAKVRTDVRMMSNYLLQIMPRLRPHFIFVDPFNTPSAIRKNIAGTRQCMDWVRAGHCLSCFPAGEVSSLSLRTRSITDPRWSPAFYRVARQAGATILPMFWEGRNSDLFQFVGLIHPRLRTALLTCEMMRLFDATLSVRIGNPIPWTRLQDIGDQAGAVEYVRMRTYMLRERETPQALRTGSMTTAKKGRIEEPIAPAVPIDKLVENLGQLPESQLLVRSGEYEVYWGRAHQLPNILHEIGRLREMAFRPVGEGTGRAVDLDQFDGYYVHLLVWHRIKRQIIGAYRLGLSEEIIPAFGKSGLYTTTLFRFEDRLLSQIRPAIELGRSFVHPAFQKEYAPLLLLWRGIGVFIAQRPEYRRLFGPVSISNEYKSMTKHLLMAFLRLNRFHLDLSRLIRPRNPPKQRTSAYFNTHVAGRAVRDIDEVNELVREIESNRRSMPVLLRQYLKLNGRLLAFNVDPDFGDVLDGLMLIDLTEVDRGILCKYMGNETAASFLAHHGIHIEPKVIDRAREESPVGRIASSSTSATAPSADN
ncbi:MAG: lysophospholipid acyltransferase family protein [Phycisphaeraceae bacterium]|nr:lysophospholipid acyltransferase family protein [Phycisphaeraceae bacterium]